MSSTHPSHQPGHHEAPPVRTGLYVLTGVLVAVPIVALMLVGTYAKDGPRIIGVPFFFWYQLLWVFLTSAFTYAAYVVVRKARPHRPMNPEGTEFLTGNADGAREGDGQ